MCVCALCVRPKTGAACAGSQPPEGPPPYLLSVLAQLMVRRHFANAHHNSNTQCIFRRTRASSALRRAILHLKKGGCVEHANPRRHFPSPRPRRARASTRKTLRARERRVARWPRRRPRAATLTRARTTTSARRMTPRRRLRSRIKQYTLRAPFESCLLFFHKLFLHSICVHNERPLMVCAQ